MSGDPFAARVVARGVAVRNSLLKVTSQVMIRQWLPSNGLIPRIRWVLKEALPSRLFGIYNCLRHEL